MKKNILITGASTGIGEQTTLELARQGFHVFAGVRRAADGDTLKSKNPQNITPVQLDVTKTQDIVAAVEHIQSKGELWGLVNNAGIVVAGPLEFLTVDDLRDQFEVNVYGLHNVTTHFLPLLRQSRGRVVHVGSISGKFAFPFVGPYCASKHAVEALADCLRRELSDHGIKVSLIEPGRTRTPIWNKSRVANQSRSYNLNPKSTQYYGRPLNKLREFTEMANTVGSPTSKVTKAILHALSSAHPRTRYVVGLDAKIEGVIGRFFPARVADFIVKLILS